MHGQQTHSVSMQPTEDVMKALMSKLYQIVTGNDDSIAMPRLSISWIMPGLPFTPEDFDFLKFGTHGDTVERTNQLLEQQLVVSKLFDFIPELPEQLTGDSTDLTIRQHSIKQYLQPHTILLAVFGEMF